MEIIVAGIVIFALVCMFSLGVKSNKESAAVEASEVFKHASLMSPFGFGIRASDKVEGLSGYLLTKDEMVRIFSNQIFLEQFLLRIDFHEQEEMLEHLNELAVDLSIFNIPPSFEFEKIRYITTAYEVELRGLIAGLVTGYCNDYLKRRSTSEEGFNFFNMETKALHERFLHSFPGPIDLIYQLSKTI
ncbi:hypothetical protein L5M43_13565 [Shewanella sp. SW36]|uniref:hypothetical protein n=1 Tax=unclassified Shewanella TaxID=196818 RepID=UPI0021D89DEF|nr:MULTISPECIES: hypothetical protein [unclassified Shewanella]MCU7976269.1 hypothetical protein [Shewanella sp. SW36]MCU7991509.1 hypothetical protein [Shewanella sp. SW1]MCU8052329.1 hypothetical protein [Shewanella sp. SM43]